MGGVEPAVGLLSVGAGVVVIVDVGFGESVGSGVFRGVDVGVGLLMDFPVI